MSTTSQHPSRSLTATLFPFALIVFLGYSALGIPLSTMPVQVNAVLGFGTTVVGVIIGLSAVATLLTRQIAGSLADRRGPKFAVLVGLLTTALSGVAYLVSLALSGHAALALLAVGRIVLGLGDSLFTTGIMAWAVTRVGAHNAGRAMAWIGIAMYGALAVGAPLGAALNAGGGFAWVCVATAIMPLLAIPVAIVLPGLAKIVQKRGSFMGVVRAIWVQGLAMVLASAGFGTIAAFLPLRYAALGWSGAGLALTFAGLPDRLGGTKVAVASLIVEAAGLVLIAAAPHPAVAVLGAALTGLGYSLIFPSLGVEAVRRVSAESRGVALGAFLACFDLGLGASGPAAGLVAGGLGLPASFIAASCSALVSMLLVLSTRGRAGGLPRRSR
jgi:MFS family permease